MLLILTRTLPTLLFTALITVILMDGWLHRADGTINAEQGIGYVFGIVGGSLMLIMLLYSLRKRIRIMRNLGATRHWFRMHMLFGVIGPTLILYHANFRHGSLNSTVALYCMILVAASGLVGRFIYARIHNGLYGNLLTARDLREQTDKILDSIDASHPAAEMITALLKDEESRMHAHRNKFLRNIPWLFLSWLRVYAINLRTRKIMHGMLSDAINKGLIGRTEAKRLYKETSQKILRFMRLTQKSSRLSLYTRMFSVWHIVHVPFFIMMIASGIVHVIAVHAY